MSAMLQVVVGSLRHRARAFTATAITLVLGAVVVMSFASLLDTASDPDATATDREVLITMASVVGLIGTAIVVFAAASSMALLVRQRSAEVALLRTAGATTGQVRRAVVAEAAVAACLATLAAVVPAALVGRLIVGLLHDGGRIGEATGARFGPVALVAGLVATVFAAVVGARVAADRALRATDLASASTAAAGGGAGGAGDVVEAGRATMPRRRKVVAGVFLAFGVETAVLTATLFHGKGSEAMQTGGQASIWAAVGLAILAPALARLGATVLAGPVRRLGGELGDVALHGVRRRAREMAGPLMPIILFTAIATGTITMQAIEDGAAAVAGAPATVEDRTIETLNFVVVGMIAVFAGVMVLNTLVAATSARRREFGQQRLAGMTPGDVLTVVRLETLVLVVTGVACGTVASLFTIVPYSIARTGDVVPPTGAGTWLAVAAAATALAVGATARTARRALRTPAVEAVAST